MKLGEDIMDVFQKRVGQFKNDYYRGNNQCQVHEAKRDINNCTSVKIQDYKFKKLRQKYGVETMIRTFCSENPKDKSEGILNLNRYKNQL